MNFRVIGQGNGRCKMARNVGIIATSLSVAVVIISVIVSGGFREAVERKVVELIDYSHLRAGSALLWGSGSEVFEPTIIEDINDIIAPQKLQEVVEGQGVLIKNANLVPTILKGVDTIKNGCVVLSKSTARVLGVGVGEFIEVTGAGSNEFRTLEVSGVYSSGIEDIESAICVVSPTVARDFSTLDSTQISYYSIARRVSNGEELVEFVSNNNISVESAYDRAGAIFGWLEMIDNNMVLVLMIMVVVAVINIVTTTLIIMLDNTKRIATLRALGMRRGAVSWLFLLNIGKVMWRGVLYGVVVAVLLCVVQAHCEVLSLDEMAYFVSAVPVTFNPLHIFLYSAIMLLSVVVAILIPVIIVARMSITRALKYQ